MEETAKRYYWLKLQSTYFNQLEQKKMRRQENGKDMQIVYLRMMLLSIDKKGYIFYQGVYDSLEEELAEEFNEPIDIIKSTLDYLKENSMITINDNSDCFIPEVLEHIGSECYSAERMRRKRQRDKMSHCDTDVTACDEEIELEKEIEKELDIKNTSYSCTESTEIDTVQPIISLILNDKSFYDVEQKDYEEWTTLYPAVDVMQELRKMKGWCDSNPTKRKTKKGIKRFINSWLSREQDKGRVYNSSDRQQSEPISYDLPPEYQEMYDKYLSKTPSPDDPFQ